MKIIRYPQKSKWQNILKRPLMDFKIIEKKIKPILDSICLNGDAALKKYTSQFDGVKLENIKVSEEEIAAAVNLVDEKLKNAIKIAKRNIWLFHESQIEKVKKITIQNGVTCWRKSVPILKVGLYIPGGKSPLFSTVLMLGIPAKIANCTEIIICSPPDKEGFINPVILYTAQLVGISKIFKAGGAQAIGAMAYGTETIPSVNKIFGPGNQYVTAAKQLVSLNGVAIDFPAGPSELMIIADNTAKPSFIASDLLSQAEHGVDSQVLLVTDSPELLENVKLELNSQLDKLPRKAMVSESLENSKLILLKSIDEAVELANGYSPEHLILSVKNPNTVSKMVLNAGSVFLGNYSPESAGDYASGTNHTLPTNGYANVYSGVSLDSFMKKITFQKITKEGLKNLGPVIETMAAAEGLEAHKRAVNIRLNNLENI